MLSLLLLVGICYLRSAISQAPIGNASSSTIEYQLTQLERIVNAHSQVLTQLQQQLADNERDIDSLRGQIQENQHQLSQVVKQQKHIYQQLNRFHSQKTVTINNQSQISTSADNVPNTPSINSTMDKSADGNIDYKEAMTLVLEKKQYDQAINAFQNFIKRYPDSIYQPNANYWLGQLSYNQSKKDDAAYYFAIVVKNYPKSTKAPAALFKIGVIMQEKGQNDKARAIYQQVSKLYPNDNVAKQAKKRLAEL